MSDQLPPDDSTPAEPGLFKKYPKLGVLVIGAVSLALLLGMCVIVGVLILRG
jgi:hypothetical protein